MSHWGSCQGCCPCPANPTPSLPTVSEPATKGVCAPDSPSPVLGPHQGTHQNGCICHSHGFAWLLSPRDTGPARSPACAQTWSQVNEVVVVSTWECAEPGELLREAALHPTPPASAESVPNPLYLPPHKVLPRTCPAIWPATPPPHNWGDWPGHTHPQHPGPASQQAHGPWEPHQGRTFKVEVHWHPAPLLTPFSLWPGH